jgi:HTH-type transcriptional regulator/antitoxin HipB
VDYVARTPAQLGPILRSIRAERGLTQHTAGAKVGLKQSTVSAIEGDSARTSVDTLYKLLSALGRSSCLCRSGRRRQEPPLSVAFHLGSSLGRNGSALWSRRCLQIIGRRVGGPSTRSS